MIALALIDTAILLVARLVVAAVMIPVRAGLWLYDRARSAQGWEEAA